MKLRITSPTRNRTESVSWIEINTTRGNFVIQDGHVPMIITLKPNSPVLFCLENEIQEAVSISTGIAHITRESVTLIISE